MMKRWLLALLTLSTAFLATGCKDTLETVTPQQYAMHRIAIVTCWQHGKETTTNAGIRLQLLHAGLEEYAAEHYVSDRDRAMIANADRYGLNR